MTTTTTTTKQIIVHSERQKLEIRMEDTLKKLTNMNVTISLKKQIEALREDPTKITVDAARGINSIETKKLIIDPYGDSGYYRGELLRSSKSLNHCITKDKKEDVEDLMIDYNDDEVDNGNILHGLGTMEYLDGRIYEGQWNNGQWSGKGKATYPNGDTCEGMYKEDQRHGKGLYKWHDGRKYQGEFINDQRCGYGIYTWPDNSKYEGEFQDGFRHGEGKYIVSKSRNKDVCMYVCIIFFFFQTNSH